MGIYKDAKEARRANRAAALKMVFVFAFFALCAWPIVRFVQVGGVDSGQDLTRHELTKAELRCMGAIRQAVKNPSAAVITGSTSRGRNADGAGYVVNWDHGSGLRLQNGFGALIDATASCTVVNNRVSGLIINGEKTI